MTLVAGEEDAAFRLIASPSGTQVGVVEPGRVTILGVPDLAPVAEVGIDGGMENHDVGFAGERLVVLSRAGVISTLHVVDPTGPTKLGEVPYRVFTRIAAIAGDLVLTTGGGATLIVDCGKVAASPLPLRGAITAAGRLGPDRFVIAAAGVVEEWDGYKRAPGRRIRLDRPIDLLHVGGNANRIWMINRDEPNRIDVVTLASSSTRRYELPEPPRRISVHERGDLLAVVGETTGLPFVIDLARPHAVIRIETAPVLDLVWLGRSRTLVLQPIGGPLELLTLPASADGTDEEELEPAPVKPAPAPVADPSNERPPTQWSREDISARLAAWRDRHHAGVVRDDTGPILADPEIAKSLATSGAATVATSLLAHGSLSSQVAKGPNLRDRVHPGGWRGEVGAWARTILARSHRDAPTMDCGILDELVVRLDLGDIHHAIMLLYGAHLIATPVATYDLATVTGWKWDEALGHSTLAASGVVRWRGEHVALVKEALALLDERPPLTGSIILAPPATETTVAIVAPADIDAARVGAFAAPSVGALLVPNARGENKPARFLLEAQLRGLAPLVPWTRLGDALRVPPPRSAIVVDDAAIAANLELLVVATWATSAGDRD